MALTVSRHVHGLKGVILSRIHSHAVTVTDLGYRCIMKYIIYTIFLILCYCHQTHFLYEYFRTLHLPVIWFLGWDLFCFVCC